MKNRKYLFQLNHPAHFHLFKNVIDKLKSDGHQVLISIKDKDILKNLLSDYEFIQLTSGYRKNNIFSIIRNLYYRDKKLYKIVKDFNPDLMIGTSPEIGQISPLLKTPSLFFGEDDVNLSLPMYLGALTCYPFFKTILSPIGVMNSIWKRKTIYYNGFQKLAYLHPNYFQPDRSKVKIPLNKKYFFIRFANLQAYHDVNAKGISDSLANELINKLKSKGEILISSERNLPKQFEKYRFKGNLNEIHHYLYYANLFIGDSQSMAVECAMLGTPNIRFNDFVGRISVLEEIEKKLNLSIGIHSSLPNNFLEKVDSIINDDKIIEEYKERRKDLISYKIDVTAFFVWFIENYPESQKIMKKNPNYQYNFK